MSDLKEYKCPACGGSIEFDSHLQKMKCPYCDTEFELDTLKEFDEQIKREAAQEDDLSGWQTDAGGEWRLIVRNEQPLENIQISRHRVGVDILVIHGLDVFH